MTQRTAELLLAAGLLASVAWLAYAWVSLITLVMI